MLQREGDSKVSMLYVKQELLRSHIIDGKGKEHIFMFAPEGWIIADVEAIEFNEPVQLFIDCLEDSEVIIFDKDCLFKADLSKEKIVKNAQLLYRRIGKLQRRVLMLMDSPAIDRYNYFFKNLFCIT
jgi:CRP-like cAMP-binding protein